MKKISKAICSILIVLMLFNFAMCSYSPVFADEAEEEAKFDDYLKKEDVIAENESLGEKQDYVYFFGLGNLLGNALKFILSLPGVIINALVNSIGGMAGKAETAGMENEGVGLYHIFFNKLGITDINILDKNNFVHDNVTQKLENDAIVTLRDNIANWYYGIRNLAIAILLLVLIYVGIRMAISTVAEEQAKYKTMLKDWFVALVLVFVLQYIAIFFINMNNVLVDAMDPGSEGVGSIAHYQDYLYWQMFSSKLSFTQSIGALIVYSMLAWAAFGFLFQYIKRMINISFLLLIAPIITITYPIDKMGDGKAQALNKWLEEFAYGILIQPFHCLLFLVFVNTSIKLVSGSLASGVFAVLTIIFMYQAEGIIKTIFGLNKSSAAGDAIKYAATALAATNLIKGIGNRKQKSVGGGDSGNDKKEDKKESTPGQIGNTGSGGEMTPGNNRGPQLDGVAGNGGGAQTDAEVGNNGAAQIDGAAGASGTAQATGDAGNGGQRFTRTMGQRFRSAAGRAAINTLKYSFAAGAAAGGLVMGPKGALGGWAAGMGMANAAEGGIHKVSAFTNNKLSRRAYNAMSEADRQQTLNSILSDKDGSYVPQTKQQQKLTNSIRRQQADLARLGYSKAEDRNTLIRQSMEKGAQNKQFRQDAPKYIKAIPGRVIDAPRYYSGKVKQKFSRNSNGGQAENSGGNSGSGDSNA